MNGGFCFGCGAPLDPESKYCSSCGAPVAGAASKRNLPRELVIMPVLLIVAAAAFFLFSTRSQIPKAEVEAGQFQHPQVPGMPAGSETNFAEMMAGLPNDYDSLVMMGNHFMDNQVFPMAIECYERALGQRATSPDVLTDLGACYHFMGEPKKAATQFEKALALDPRHPIANFNMGIIYRELNDKEKARYYWNRYIELAPQSPITDSVKKFIKEMDK